MELNLETLAAEGWTARQKTVKGRVYIVIRKGGKDRSLGVFNEELWQRLKRLGMVRTRVDASEFEIMKDNLAKATQEIAELKQSLETVMDTSRSDDVSKLLEWKVARCPFATRFLKNVFCRKYLWAYKPSSIIRRFPHVTFKRSAMDFDGKRKKWRFTPHPDICGLCNPVDNLFSKFTENVYADVLRLKEDMTTNQVQLNYLITTATRRIRKNEHCQHLDKEGYCTYWRWSRKQLGRDQKQRSNRQWYDHVKAHPIICVACPNYTKAQKS